MQRRSCCYASCDAGSMGCRVPATPIERETSTVLTFGAGGRDRRSLKVFPATSKAAIEATTSHLVLDEWAHTPRAPEALWAALEPTLPDPGHLRADYDRQARAILCTTTGSDPPAPDAAHSRICVGTRAIRPFRRVAGTETPRGNEDGQFLHLPAHRRGRGQVAIFVEFPKITRASNRIRRDAVRGAALRRRAERLIK